jgi:hypothetical protein
MQLERATPKRLTPKGVEPKRAAALLKESFRIPVNDGIEGRIGSFISARGKRQA